MTDPTRQRTVRSIPDSLWRAVKVQAAKEGLSVTALVCKALWRYVKEEGA